MLSEQREFRKCLRQKFKNERKRGRERAPEGSGEGVNNYIPPLRNCSALQLGIQATKVSNQMASVTDPTETHRIFKDSYAIRRNLLLRKLHTTEHMTVMFPFWFTKEGVSIYLTNILDTMVRQIEKNYCNGMLFLLVFLHN